MPVRKPIALLFAQRSDQGRVRRSNDDTSVAEELSLPDGRCVVLAAIADGIGSSRAGADASRLAVSTALDCLRAGLRQPPRDERHWSALLTDALQQANTAVLNHSQLEPRLNGMGTTLMLTVVLGRRARIAHIGDSRAYVVRPAIRRPQILQLTADHTIVADLVGDGVISYAEAGAHPQRHELSRAVGVDSEVQAEVTARTLRANERLLLCTDGLTLHLSDTELARTVADAPTPQAACTRLIDLANGRGGRDNISAVVIAAAPSATPELSSAS